MARAAADQASAKVHNVNGARFRSVLLTFGTDAVRTVNGPPVRALRLTFGTPRRNAPLRVLSFNAAVAGAEERVIPDLLAFPPAG
jgi:hypothetical protein